MGEGVLAFGPDAPLTFVNRAAQQMLGLDEKRASGKALQELELTGRPETLAAIRPVFDAQTTVRQEDDVFIGAGGEPLPVSYTASPIAAGGEFIGGVLVFHDVTSRKRA